MRQIVVHAVAAVIALNCTWSLAEDCSDYDSIPTMVGFAETPNESEATCAEPGRAYVLNGLALSVFDVSDPSAPEAMTPGAWYLYNARDIAVGDHLVYAACSSAGLKVFDFTDPNDFVLVGQIPLSGQGTFCELLNQTVYVATVSVLRIVDVADPTTPTLRGSLAVSGYVRAVRRAANLLVVATDPAVLIVDVSDPTAPVVRDEITFDDWGYCSSIEIFGHYILVTRYGGWNDNALVYDISNPTDAVLVVSLTIPGVLRATDVIGDLVYVAGEGTGISVVDMREPAVPRLLFTAQLADDYDETRDLDVCDGYAYIAAYEPGLVVVDLAGGEIPPHVLSRYDTIDYGYDVCQRDGLAYVTDWGNHLQIVDFTDPRAPHLIGALDLPGSGLGLDIASHHAYVAAAASGLQIVDIATNSAPVLLSTLDLGGSACDVAVAGNLACVAMIADGLRFVDVSDPAPRSDWGAWVCRRRRIICAGTAISYWSPTALRVSSWSTPPIPPIRSCAARLTPPASPQTWWSSRTWPTSLIRTVASWWSICTIQTLPSSWPPLPARDPPYVSHATVT